MSTVAFIGLGAMGSRMAMNLHAAGHKLRVYNRDRAKTKPFADQGIEVCDSPAAAAKGAEFVCSIVSDDIATREVMLGDKGVVGAAAPGTIILDSSTNTPAMSREVARAAAAKGVVYLDAPVSGSLVQAQGQRAGDPGGRRQGGVRQGAARAGRDGAHGAPDRRFRRRRDLEAH